MAKQAGTYLELLKNPLWQKRRLEIFNRDNWTCLRCSSTDITLHVHHKKYTGNPWEAPEKDLETICEKCHRNEHAVIAEEKTSEIGSMWPLKWRNNPDISSINDEILELNQRLLNPINNEAMTEILSKIVELQKQRKEISNA